jgi:hypothetical protein
MRSWPNINYYHGICLEGLKKDHANLNLHCYRSHYLYNTTSCTRPRVAVAHSGATEAGTRNMEMLHVGVSVHCMFNGTFKED